MLTNIVVVVLVTRSVSYLGSHRCRVDIDMHSLGDNRETHQVSSGSLS